MESIGQIKKFLVIIFLLTFLSCGGMLGWRYKQLHKFDSLGFGVDEELSELSFVNRQSHEWNYGKVYSKALDNYQVFGKIQQINKKQHWIVLKAAESSWKVLYNENTEFYLTEYVQNGGKDRESFSEKLDGIDDFVQIIEGGEKSVVLYCKSITCKAADVIFVETKVKI